MTTVDPCCPHCGHVFPSMPARRRHCPACRKSVLPRRAPGETEKRLVTESQADAIEKAWATHHFLSTWLRNLAAFGVTEGDLERERAKLGTGYSDSDAIWSLMNSVATRLMGQSDYQSLASLYRYMGTFLVDDGRDSFGAFQESSRARLRAAALQGNTHAEVSAIRDVSSCDACEALDGASFTIEEALKRLPIPHPDCSSGYGFCRCMWLFSAPTP